MLVNYYVILCLDYFGCRVFVCLFWALFCLFTLDVIVLFLFSFAFGWFVILGLVFMFDWLLLGCGCGGRLFIVMVLVCFVGLIVRLVDARLCLN